jgi:hypothetical protein
VATGVGVPFIGSGGLGEVALGRQVASIVGDSIPGSF